MNTTTEIKCKISAKRSIKSTNEVKSEDMTGAAKKPTSPLKKLTIRTLSAFNVS